MAKNGDLVDMLIQGKRKTAPQHLWKAAQEDQEGYQEREKKLATQLSGQEELPQDPKKSLKLRMKARQQLFAELPLDEQEHWRAEANKGTKEKTPV